MRRTYYIYKGYDRENALAIIAPNVNKERHVAELKRLAKENGHITIRNCLGGLVSEIREDGKINSFVSWLSLLGVQQYTYDGKSN